MIRRNKIASLCVVLAAVGVFGLANPEAVQAGVGRIEGVVRRLLDDLGITVGGVFTPSGGETLAETLALGNSTGGTDIVVTLGDEITGPNGPNALVIRGGLGGAPSGTGGGVTVQGGTPTDGVAGTVRIFGGPGSTVDFGITGAPVLIKGGDGGSPNGPSGLVDIDAGAPTGVGAAGAVNVGLLNASAITIGATDIDTTVRGGLIGGAATGTTDDGDFRFGDATRELLWDVSADTLTISAEGLATGTIQGADATSAATNGAALALVGGAGNTTGTGGVASLTGGAGGASSGALGGTANLTAGAPGAGNVVGANATVRGGAGAGSGKGGAARLLGAAAGSTGAGGDVIMVAADGGVTSGVGGSALLDAGNALGGDSAGGLARLEAGSASGSATGGAASVTAGLGGNTGVGGAASLAGGAGGVTSGNGGDVTISGGIASTGTDGRVVFVSGGTTYGLTVAGVGPALTTTAQTIIEAINEVDAASGAAALSTVLATGDTMGANAIVADNASSIIRGADVATGTALVLRGGNSSGAATVGGLASLTGGSGNTTGTGGVASVTGGAAGVSAIGGTASLTGGTGGATSGQGGTARVTGGAAIASGQGGTAELIGGVGAGAANGGTVNVTGGAPPAAGATGGIVNVTGGAGGNGGPVNVTGGAAALTGVGGAASLIGGAGGATSGASGTITIASGTTTDGVSGAVSISSGNALGGTNNSGNVTVDSGTSGGGTTGTVTIAGTNADSLALGRSGLTTTFTGSSNLTVLNGVLTTAAGAEGAPAILSTDADSGIYFTGAFTVITSNAANVLSLGPNSINPIANFSGDLRLNSAIELTWNGDTFFGRAADGVLRIGTTTDSADGVLDVSGGGVTSVMAGGGANATPSITFGDADTGIRGSAANVLDLVTLGTVKVSLQGGTDMRLRNGFALGFSSGAPETTAADGFIERGGAAGIIDVNATKAGLGDGTLRLADLHAQDDGRVILGLGSDYYTQGESTSLTDGSATTIFSIPMVDGDVAGVKVTWTIKVVDSSGDIQTEHGTAQISILDHTGGVVADAIGLVRNNPIEEAGTLTPSVWTLVTTDDTSIEVQVLSDSDLTVSTMVLSWKAEVGGISAVLTVP